MRKILLSIAEYVCCFLVYWLLRLPFHEFAHLRVARMFGGDGYIEFTLWGAATFFTKTPEHPTIVAFAGGLGTAGFFAVLLAFKYDDRDWEEIAAILPNLCGELFYGIFEGLLLPSIGFFAHKISFSAFLQWGMIIGLIGWTVGLVLGWYLWLKNLLQRLE